MGIWQLVRVHTCVRAERKKASDQDCGPFHKGNSATSFSPLADTIRPPIGVKGRFSEIRNNLETRHSVTTFFKVQARTQAPTNNNSLPVFSGIFE